SLEDISSYLSLSTARMGEATPKYEEITLDMATLYGKGTSFKKEQQSSTKCQMCTILTIFALHLPSSQRQSN
nr:hypothetical protein [Tanacetum cinerariifolium]